MAYYKGIGDAAVFDPLDVSTWGEAAAATEEALPPFVRPPCEVIYALPSEAAALARCRKQRAGGSPAPTGSSVAMPIVLVAGGALVLLMLFGRKRR